MRKRRKQEQEQLLDCLNGIKAMVQNQKKTKDKDILAVMKKAKVIFNGFSAQKGDSTMQKKELKNRVSSLFANLEEELKRSGM